MCVECNIGAQLRIEELPFLAQKRSKVGIERGMG
jgi:hypothetical protein